MNQHTTNQNVPELSARRPQAAGRSVGGYRCGHCGDAVTPSPAQIAQAENSPATDPALKCPHCHKHTVHWRMVAPAWPKLRPCAVSIAHGRELFAGIYKMLAAS